MNAFLIGLQFLTRIFIVKQTVWTEEDFGKSVKYFPLVGAVLGVCYAAVLYLLMYFTGGRVPLFTGAAGFFLTVTLTGGIHCDGMMDSFDGLFSGRERDKMLEIMKDSRAGAFGVVGMVTVAALDISAIAELAKTSAVTICAAMYVTPIIGRLMMVLTIGLFPYARPTGMGKAFAQYTTRKTLSAACLETILLLLPLIFVSAEIFLTAIFALVIALVFALYFGKFATSKLGGVTGDIYGAVEMLSETISLIVFMAIHAGKFLSL